MQAQASSHPHPPPAALHSPVNPLGQPLGSKPTPHLFGQTRGQNLPHNALVKQDTIERGYQADVSGDAERAVKLYLMGLEVVDEALRVRAPSSGEEAAL